jgi:hypothetical protein
LFLLSAKVLLATGVFDEITTGAPEEPLFPEEFEVGHLKH